MSERAGSMPKPGLAYRPLGVKSLRERLAKDERALRAAPQVGVAQRLADMVELALEPAVGVAADVNALVEGGEAETAQRARIGGAMTAIDAASARSVRWGDGGRGGGRGGGGRGRGGGGGGAAAAARPALLPRPAGSTRRQVHFASQEEHPFKSRILQGWSEIVHAMLLVWRLQDTAISVRLGRLAANTPSSVGSTWIFASENVVASGLRSRRRRGRRRPSCVQGQLSAGEDVEPRTSLRQENAEGASPPRLRGPLPWRRLNGSLTRLSLQQHRNHPSLATMVDGPGNDEDAAQAALWLRAAVSRHRHHRPTFGRRAATAARACTQRHGSAVRRASRPQSRRSGRRGRGSRRRERQRRERRRARRRRRAQERRVPSS